MSELCAVVDASDATIINEPQPDSILDSRLLLLKQRRLCDVIFTFPNSTERIEAHQLYLRERSPVFDLIFETPEASATGCKREVEISESTPARFWEFLEFFYADTFQATKSGALDLLHLALKYKVEPLTKKCEALIKTEVTMEEALEVFETASRYEKRDLMKKAGDLLATHVGTLWPKLMEAQESTLNYLLRRDDLSVKECDLFTFLLKWGKNRPGGENDLKGVLKNLIYLVRYTCMTPNEFTTNVVPSGLLSAEELVQIYSFFSSDPDVRSEIGANMNFTVAPRQGEKEQRSVRFYSKPTQFWTCEGNKPLKECTSFTAKIGPQSSPSVWCEFSEKRPSITTLYIRWPSRAVENSDLKDENLNFKVALSSCVGPIRENNMEEIFSSMLAQCAGGEIAEINVEPPVELNNGTKYCITVEDLSAHASKLTTSSSTGTNPDPTASVRFTYCAPNKVNWIRNSSANLENWPAGLRDVEPSSNLTGFGNYGDLQLAVGLLLALV